MLVLQLESRLPCGKMPRRTRGDEATLTLVRGGFTGQVRGAKERDGYPDEQRGVRRVYQELASSGRC